jgi:CHAD domain-containing protein
MRTKQSASKRKTPQDGALLITALDERRENYRVQVRICRGEFSEEAVHDLRVSARRLLAILDIARTLDPHPHLQKARRTLKNQIDDLDDLRDVQVMLVEVSETPENFADLKSFEIHLQERERKLLKLAKKQILALKLSELKKRIETIREALEKRKVEGNFPAQLLQAVDHTYARTLQVSAQVDASQPGTIHRLRLAFKKFRYMAEIVQPTIPGQPETYLERMHKYQSTMGDIHDIEVFLSALTDFSEKGAVPFDPKPIRSFYEKHHTELVSAFMEDKGELFAFWRAAPDQPFPWENKHDPVHHPSRNRRGSGRVRRGRQPASVDQQGPEENASHRTGLEGTGDPTGRDPDQPLPASGPDGENPGEGI